MARRKKAPRGRPVNGILLFDKPLGKSSNDALQRVKWLYFAQKAGHTGSLDPLASGLLPICFGEATKLSGFLLDADKTYELTGELGRQTATGDTEGDVIAEQPIDVLSEAQISAVLEQFTGNLQQIPPMYSALHHEGKRLYEYAREGITVEREPRPITIYSCELLSYDHPHISLRVRCSKGTYIRTLMEDIAVELGSVGHVTKLRRTGVGPFSAIGGKMYTLDELEAEHDRDKFDMDRLLQPIDAALLDKPALTLTSDATFYLEQGNPVMIAQAPEDTLIRLYDMDEQFIGVGEVNDDGLVAPKRLMNM